MSLDGYVADEEGNFTWLAPDEEVHAFVNELTRPIGVYLLGRRMYEVLSVWETPEALGKQSPIIHDFAEIWRAAEKVVYSRMLHAPSTSRTRIEHDFDPEVVRGLKASATSDISVGGPDLAAQAIRSALVDEYHLFLNPVVVGGGAAALPHDVHLDL